MLLSYFLLVFVCYNLISGESDIQKALETKPKNIIRCGKTAHDDTILPAHALAKLAKGDMLIIEPGAYEELIINQDSVIISTAGQIPRGLSIVIRGKNCILKDCVADRVQSGQSFSIVNSAIDNLYLEGDQKKAEISIYNTAIGSINNWGYDKEWNIFIKNCVIRYKSPYPAEEIARLRIASTAAIHFSQRSIFEIQNSVIYASPYVFLFHMYNKSIKAKLTLKNNILFGENGLGKVDSYSNDKNNNLIILELRDIKKIVSLNVQGENKIENIEFAGDRIKDPAYYTVKSPQIKDIGIIVEENKFFSQPALELIHGPPLVRPLPHPPIHLPENPPREQKEEKEEDQDVFE